MDTKTGNFDIVDCNRNDRADRLREVEVEKMFADIRDGRYVLESGNIYSDASKVSGDIFGIDYDYLLKMWSSRNKLLLHGAPGTGKTVLAKIICRELANKTGKQVYFMLDSFIDKQKEDIVGGLTLNTSGGVEWSDGSLTELCRVACTNMDNIYVYIIDEMNRSDAMMALGALSQAMEQIDTEINIGKGKYVALPSNLYFIATMNDYDRGAAKIDLALLSRFTSVKIDSLIYNKDTFLQYLSSNVEKENEHLLNVIAYINQLRSDEFTMYSGELIEIGVRELLIDFNNKEDIFEIIKTDISTKLRYLAKQSKNNVNAMRVIDNIVKECDIALKEYTGG